MTPGKHPPKGGEGRPNPLAEKESGGTAWEAKIIDRAQRKKRMG
jgi:hypothetical protein